VFSILLNASENLSQPCLSLQLLPLTQSFTPSAIVTATRIISAVADLARRRPELEQPLLLACAEYLARGRHESTRSNQHLHSADAAADLLRLDGRRRRQLQIV